MKYQTWYIHQDGRQYGPITERELLYLARISKLDPDAHVWSVGLPRWRRAGDLEGLYRPPPLDGPDAALDPTLGPAALPRPVVRDSPVAALPSTSTAPERLPSHDDAKRQPGAGIRSDGAVDAVPMARRAGRVAAQTLPASEPDAQDHANDNIVKREEEIARLLFERVATLEKAIEKEARDRRRLKSAIEALVDYLAAESDGAGGSRPVPRLARATRAIAPPRDDGIEREDAAETGEVEERASEGRRFVVAPNAPAAPGYIALHWFGEHSLGRSFWMNSFAPALALTLATAVVAASARHSDLWADLSLAAVLIGSGPLFLWMVVGVLRSARRVRLITGRRIGPGLARAWVLIMLLAWLGTPAVIRFYPALVPAPVLSIIDVTGEEPASRKGDKAPEGKIIVPRPEPSGTEPVPAPASGETPSRRGTA